MRTYKVIGLMSGSSMDGIDLAYCEFAEENGKWSYDVLQAETIEFDLKWSRRLAELDHQDAQTYAKSHVYFGHYLGNEINNFLRNYQLKPDFISSHGHTIFHQPEVKFTAQIGDGAAISAITGLPVVCEFRNMDVALGGHGAPLVPIGEMFLYPEFGMLLNLGGIANLSVQTHNGISAYDICPANYVLNHLMQHVQKQAYDKGGELASTGTLNHSLLEFLDALDYYKLPNPKSLGKEWIKKHFLPYIYKIEIPIEDKMRTLVEHITDQISLSVKNAKSTAINTKLLISGGGVYNQFQMEQLKQKTSAEIIIPDDKTIQFKEAIIFAFLGVLRILNRNNSLKSVTGANKDNIGGALHGNFNNLL